MNKITINKIEDELEEIDPEEKQFIETNISKSMSETDLIRQLGQRFKDDIILYSNLDQYESIEQLLPSNKSFKIILVRDSPNAGHWVLILRYGKVIEWWDSFGLYPGNELNYVDQNENQQLDQTKDEIITLLNKARQKGYRIIYNKKKYQEFSSDVRTISVCGRYVSLRIIMLLKYNYNLNQFTNFMEQLKKESGLKYDEFIALIIK